VGLPAFHGVGSLPGAEGTLGIGWRNPDAQHDDGSNGTHLGKINLNERVNEQEIIVKEFWLGLLIALAVFVPLKILGII